MDRETKPIELPSPEASGNGVGVADLLSSDGPNPAWLYPNRSGEAITFPEDRRRQLREQEERILGEEAVREIHDSVEMYLE